uniref:Uncharacterized protein n=1 Tax=Peronospora matthiolae TaxID=2874970 RepID=A0AAV1TAK4_9STRA
MSAYSPPRPIKTLSDTTPPSDDELDAVHRLLDYLETFPADAGAVELKDQLSAFTHHDLRAACSRLNLCISKRQNKKGGYISALVAYWLALTTPNSMSVSDVTPQSTPRKSPKKGSKSSKKPAGMELPADVAQFVQLFPPHGHVQELQDQLNACRSRTLRSACVVLDLHPRKSCTKVDFLGLLVNYWQDSSAVTPSVATELEEEKEMDVVLAPPPPPPLSSSLSSSSTKRVRVGDDDVKKVVKKKKNVKEVERRGGDVGDDKTEKWAASLDKAKVVKEWASAIEILSRVDGSAESIESIRSLIDSVVNSATSEM